MLPKVEQHCLSGANKDVYKRQTCNVAVYNNRYLYLLFFWKGFVRTCYFQTLVYHTSGIKITDTWQTSSIINMAIACMMFPYIFVCARAHVLISLRQRSNVFGFLGRLRCFTYDASCGFNLFFLVLRIKRKKCVPANL